MRRPSTRTEVQQRLRKKGPHLGSMWGCSQAGDRRHPDRKNQASVHGGGYADGDVAENDPEVPGPLQRWASRVLPTRTEDVPSAASNTNCRGTAPSVLSILRTHHWGTIRALRSSRPWLRPSLAGTPPRRTGPPAPCSGRLHAYVCAHLRRKGRELSGRDGDEDLIHPVTVRVFGGTRAVC